MLIGSRSAQVPELCDGLTGVFAAAPLGAEEEVYRPPVGLLRRQGVLGSSLLEIIRFAAVNRLCLDLARLSGKHAPDRTSLRRTGTGDILLYAVRTDSSEWHSYRLGHLQCFAPRFAVELTSSELSTDDARHSASTGSFHG